MPKWASNVFQVHFSLTVLASPTLKDLHHKTQTKCNAVYTVKSGPYSSVSHCTFKGMWDTSCQTPWEAALHHRPEQPVTVSQSLLFQLTGAVWAYCVPHHTGTPNSSNPAPQNPQQSLWYCLLDALKLGASQCWFHTTFPFQRRVGPTRWLWMHTV